MKMHWSWMTFFITLPLGVIIGLGLAGLGLWAFAMGMRDE